MPGKSFWDMATEQAPQSRSTSKPAQDPAAQQPAGNAAAQEELEASKKGSSKAKKGPMSAIIINMWDIDVPNYDDEGNELVPDTEWGAIINVGERHGVTKRSKVEGGGDTGSVMKVYPTRSKIRWYSSSAPPTDLTVYPGKKYTRNTKRKANEKRRKEREAEEAKGAFQADFDAEYSEANRGSDE